MTPNLTAAEVAKMQQECREALKASEKATGLEKLRLINLAFPFAIQGNAQGLLIAWAGDGWSVSDIGGFITKLEKDDVCTMLVMIGMESGRRGSVRETVTGKAKVPKTVFPPLMEKVQKSKLQLKDIGL